jgi:uncharacterized NAD(P)/FAD-binding protein YdhS
MSKLNTELADITFIGAGISMVYTFLKVLKKLNSTHPQNPLKINIIDKYPEFFCGIPYGKRSGKSVLLINSLRAFLPENEREIFINYLVNNKNTLIDGYLNAGGSEAERWLLNNKKEIDANQWDDLFVPRSFFGEYISNKVNKAINDALDKNLIEVNYIVSEVVDLIKNNEITEVKLGSGESVYTKINVLCLGSLPLRKIYLKKMNVEDSEFLLVNDIYNKDLDSNFKHIENFISNRKGKETNVLIIGANASSLETIYKLNNKSDINNSITKYTILSTHGLMPDSEINDELKNNFIPKNLISLKNKKHLTAKEIGEAAFKDINLANNINLGAASSVDIISKAFGDLFKKLNKKELEIFACKYGNEIGRKQRCAGVHYLLGN